MTLSDDTARLNRRMTELADVAATRLPRSQVAATRATLLEVVRATGVVPGVFLDEEDRLEARWLFCRTSETPAQVLHVTFADPIDVYVFDRSKRNVTLEATFQADVPDVAERIATIVRSTRGVSDVAL